MAYGNRILAMCDILGFKALNSVKPLTEVKDLYEKLMLKVTPDACISERIGYERGIGVTTREFMINHIIFSDTLLLWLDINETTECLDLGAFFSTICILIEASFHLKLPLRVGVAFGECYIDPEKNIYIGKPIIDAHLMEENQKWVGGSLHSSCLKLPDRLQFPKSYIKWDSLIKYEAPFKWKVRKKEISNIVINWGGEISIDGFAWLQKQCKNKSLKRKDRKKYCLAMRFYNKNFLKDKHFTEKKVRLKSK